MEATKRLTSIVSWTQACLALGVARVSEYRFFRRKETPVVPKEPVKPEHSLSDAEREHVRMVLHSERFADIAPQEVYATLLDDGIYLCSVRTMYRILEKNKEVRKRRNQAAQVEYAKPELLSTRPNELWSWEIAKLKGLVKWSYFHLYVIIDVFSRYVVGWMVADNTRGPGIVDEIQMCGAYAQRSGCDQDALSPARLK